MTTSISVRFYRIGSASKASFEDALTAITAAQLKDRELNIADSDNQQYLVRLEQLDKSDPPLYCGEFVRRVLKNNPPEATPDALKPITLGEGSGLGYQVAFAYHPGLRIIAVEHSPRSLALSRILLYCNMAAKSDFKHDVLVREDAWDKFNAGATRKIVLSIANPENLPAVEGQVGGVLTSTSKLKEISDAPMITIEVSMGRKKGFLNEDFARVLTQFFTTGEGRKQDVRKLHATTKPLDGGASEEIDFIDEVLKVKDTIDLSEDPVKNYEVRKAFVRSTLRSELPHLQAAYGQRA